MNYHENDITTEQLSRKFYHFAELQAIGHSPLYEKICYGIAADNDVLHLSGYALVGQPIPNILLASVHYLLLKGAQHPLAAYYPDVSEAARPFDDVYPVFHDFCLQFRDEIKQQVAVRLTQTNETGRCALLLPVFNMVAERAKKPLALIEVGTSAGLNLLWDQYGYRYSDGQTLGISDASLVLQSEVRGDQHPPIPASFPVVASRVGIDINPLDLHDPENALWLRALVWPDDLARAKQLQNAINIAQKHSLELIKGDALEILPRVLENVPTDSVPCVFHSYVLNQFSPENRERFYELLQELAAQRDLYCIGIEHIGAHVKTEVKLAAFEGGVRSDTVMAYCHDHGKWIEWIAG